MKQRPDVNLFIAEYLRDGNGRRAAIAAGYSAKTADSQASRLLRNVKVRAEVGRHQAEIIAKVQRDTGITLERTLREIAKIAFHSVEDIRAADKTRAIDMLMRHLGGYADDNKQKDGNLAQALADFAAQLHARGAGRLPIRRGPRA